MEKEEDSFSDSELQLTVDEFGDDLESPDYKLKKYGASDMSDEGSLSISICDRENPLLTQKGLNLESRHQMIRF